MFFVKIVSMLIVLSHDKIIVVTVIIVEIVNILAFRLIFEFLELVFK